MPPPEDEYSDSDSVDDNDSTSGEESDDGSRDEESDGGSGDEEGSASSPAKLSQDYQYCQAVAGDAGGDSGDDAASPAETPGSASGDGGASMAGLQQGSVFNRNGAVTESLFAAQQCFAISSNKSAPSSPPGQLCQPIGVAGTKRTVDEMNGFTLPTNGYHPAGKNAQPEKMRVAQPYQQRADLGGQHRSLHQGPPAGRGADLLQQQITPIAVNFGRPMGFGGQLGLKRGRNPDDNLMRELDEADQGGELPTYLQNIARRRQIEDESLQRFFQSRTSQFRQTGAGGYGVMDGMATGNQSGMDPNFTRMASHESGSSNAQARVEMAMIQDAPTVAIHAGQKTGGNPDIATFPVPQGKSQDQLFCLPVQVAPLSRASSRSGGNSPTHPPTTLADESKRSAETDQAAAASLLSLSAKDDEEQPAKKAASLLSLSAKDDEEQPAKKARVDTQQQVPQVLEGDSEQNQCMTFLRPEEREDFKTTDYLFYVVSHFRVCHFEEKDRGGGKRKGIALGFPGLCCSFCGEKKVGGLGECANALGCSS